MGQDYDKILKENIEALIIPLADKLLGLSLGKLEELPDDIQATLERKPDFLKRVTEGDGSPYILHIEFQVKAVLAISSNFKKSEVNTVVPEILRKLKSLTNDERKLRRYVRQLEILSNLRDLQPATIKYAEAMPITYNLETDVRYQQGIEKGVEEDKGVEKMIVSLLQSGLLPDRQIAEVADTTLKNIQRIKQQIKKK